MTDQFLELGQVEIKKGYLSVKGEKMSPVYNEAFEAEQAHAEYIITFAKMAKGKNFKTVEADDLSAFRKEVIDALGTKDKKFVASPKVVKRPTTEALKTEALDFIKFQEESVKVDKINEFLTRFNTIDEFEETGLFFEPGKCKLNKIYTMKEITKAVTEVIDLLD